jgi:hypothetical protein
MTDWFYALPVWLATILVLGTALAVGLILWAIGLVGSFLTVSYASAFSRSRFNTMMIAGISITLGLKFLFMYEEPQRFAAVMRAIAEAMEANTP